MSATAISEDAPAMTVAELLDQIERSFELGFAWMTDFVREFFSVFFHRASWMDSSVVTVGIVILSYIFIFFWIIDSAPVKYIFDSDFRRQKRKEADTKKLAEAKRRLREKERKKIEAERFKRTQEENKKLWSEQAEISKKERDKFWNE